MDLNQGKKVVVAGHVCLDISPVFPESCRSDIKQLLIPGKLINVENAKIHIGGAVGNTGLAMAFFGSDVRLMGKIGQDAFGEIIDRIVEAQGISGRMIISPTSHTSFTIVLAIPGQDRIFLHDPGANDTFDYEDLDMAVIKEASLFHFGYPPLMKCLYGHEGRKLTKIFKEVSSAGVVTSLDMAAVDANSPASQVDWLTILSNTLPFVDIFMPSVEELLFMLDRKKYFELVREADGRELTTIINVIRDVQPLAEKVLALGTKILLIKCGEPGLYYKISDSKNIELLSNKLGFALTGWEDREGFESSYIPEQVVSANGAGDVTIAAFLTSLLCEYSLRDCLKYAVASGASCVEALDPISGLRQFKAIQEKIDSGWAKII